MADFIRIQYQMDKLTDSQVRSFASKWLTWEQVDEILGGNE